LKKEKAVAVDMPVDLEIWKLNTRRECSRLGRNEANV